VLAHEALEEHLVLAHARVEHLEGDAQPVIVALGEIDLRLAAFADALYQREAGDQRFFHRPYVATPLSASPTGIPHASGCRPRRCACARGASRPCDASARRRARRSRARAAD